jgi:glyceraldehyde 3-phosphate dehydrogenase
MSYPVAINGVGRIGRALIRQIAARQDLRLAAVNDLAPVERLARLLARDTFLGPFPGGIDVDGGQLVVDGHPVPVYGEQDPADVPWARHGTRLVVEATGTLTRGRAAAVHFADGVEHVVVSGNAPEADITVCYGVNHHLVDPARHRLISNSSCTTNCLAAVADVLHGGLGIERALLNTVHCFNNSQSLTDAPHADPRRARSAAVNMIPTTTGAAAAIGLVLPALANRVTGFAVRVPAAQVSLIDLVAELARPTTLDEVNDLFRRAAAGTHGGILSVSDDECVSSDFIGDNHSAIVDLPLTQLVGDETGRLVRVVAWYDNEMGYASRLADLAAWLGA